MDELDFGYFPNQGFVKTKLPADLYGRLKVECLELQSNTENEYNLLNFRQELESYFKQVVSVYQSHYNTNSTNWPLSIDNVELQNLWINYQNKGEFNPPHTHTGSYSFVIWIQVPYYTSEEFNHPSASYNNKIRPDQLAGSFMFQYTNILGEIRDMYYDADKNYEGCCFLFPATLTHQVFPFYSSNDVRITLSGNIGQRI